MIKYIFLGFLTLSLFPTMIKRNSQIFPLRANSHRSKHRTLWAMQDLSMSLHSGTIIGATMLYILFTRRLYNRMLEMSLLSGTSIEAPMLYILSLYNRMLKLPCYMFPLLLFVFSLDVENMFAQQALYGPSFLPASVCVLQGKTQLLLWLLCWTLCSSLYQSVFRERHSPGPCNLAMCLLLQCNYSKANVF